MHCSKQFSSVLLVVSLGLAGVGSGLAVNASAQTIETNAPTKPSLTLKPDLEPLDLEALAPGNTPAYVVTANKISLTQLTVPSLWWLRDQLADQETYGNNLLENWLAYPSSGRPGRVDLVVNRQLWSLLDYLDRYAFIHRFGKTARDYGYNVRVFDGQATLLGASTCDFSTINIDDLQNRPLSEGLADTEPTALEASLPTSPADTIACSILLDSSGRGGLRGGSNRLPGAGAAKALDIAKP
ncbi:hypothetical protein H6F86_06960 [Phormidium sp. FACHB-592]|uniref:Uncharacterized protein n=2 Tax=Cyanophyceae TaxID=3028117 RepID=A0ABV0KHS7_9CYAN|nr:hypothetical protein [Phormidium sp. FACHB-592]